MSGGTRLQQDVYLFTFFSLGSETMKALKGLPLKAFVDLLDHALLQMYNRSMSAFYEKQNLAARVDDTQKYLTLVFFKTMSSLVYHMNFSFSLLKHIYML